MDSDGSNDINDKLKETINELKHQRKELFSVHNSFVEDLRHIFNVVDQKIKEMEDDLKKESFKNDERLQYYEQRTLERKARKFVNSHVTWMN